MELENTFPTPWRFYWNHLALFLNNLSSHILTDKIAERKHRHFFEVTRSLLLSASIRKCYWAEAVLTAALLINITSSSVTADISSYSRMYGHSFNYSLLRTFDCVCFIFFPSYERDKLSFKTSKCIFLGYNSAHKENRCYDPTTKWLGIARHVSFFKNVPYYQSSHVPDLSFFDTTTTQTSTHLVPTYTPSLPTFTSSSLISLTESSPSSMDVPITRCLWLLRLFRVTRFLLAEIYHAIVTLLPGIVPLLTQHVLLRFHYLFLSYILYRSLSLILRL